MNEDARIYEWLTVWQCVRPCVQLITFPRCPPAATTSSIMGGNLDYSCSSSQMFSWAQVCVFLVVLCSSSNSQLGNREIQCVHFSTSFRFPTTLLLFLFNSTKRSWWQKKITTARPCSIQLYYANHFWHFWSWPDVILDHDSYEKSQVDKAWRPMNWVIEDVVRSSSAYYYVKRDGVQANTPNWLRWGNSTTSTRTTVAARPPM